MDGDNIIILGGNGFIGFETVHAILDRYSAEKQAVIDPKCSARICNLILVNRGKSWDWNKLDVLKKACHSLCTVEHVLYNRRRCPETCDELVAAVAGVKTFTAVVDFSAYKQSELETFVNFIRGRCRVYVFISTDSVYDVVSKKKTSVPIVETDVIHQTLESTHGDKYGLRKLECEKYLHWQSSKDDGVSFVVLRLSDVIGARDSTNRFWQFMLWIQLCRRLKIPLYVHSTNYNENISLCYVTDIANCIASCLFCETTNCMLSSIRGECFNLAADDSVTVSTLIQQMLEYGSCTTSAVEVVVNGNHNIPQIYPSVSCGPLCISKAQTMLGWIPSALSHAIKETMSFYDHVMNVDSYVCEKKECLKELMDDLQDLYPEIESGVLRKSLKVLMNL